MSGIPTPGPQSGAKREAMDPQVLTYNRANPVTSSVERVFDPFPGVSSAVVKTIARDGEVVVPHWVAGYEPGHWNLWDREPLAYESGLVDLFSSTGLRSPRLLDRVDRSDGMVELWLEDVEGVTAAALTLEDHHRINGRLGQGQGAFAAAAGSSGEQSPAWLSTPWLSRHWLRQYSTSRPPGIEIYDNVEAWEHPVAIDGYGELRHEIRRRFGELYRDAGRWLSLLESLPQTLCHLDHWPNNAIAAADGTDVLIDWSFVGPGAVGEDPGNWVPDTLFDHFMEPETFAELDATVWAAYRGGLELSGWEHPPELARLGMCASAVKYIWLPGLMVDRAGHVGPTGYGSQDGFPLVEVFARRAPVFLHLLEWIDRARKLLEQLGDEVRGLGEFSGMNGIKGF